MKTTPTPTAMCFTRSVILCLLGSSMLTSCDTIAPVLEDAGKMAGGGAIIGGVAGRYWKGGSLSRGQKVMVGTAAGAAGGWLVSKAYTYSANQKRDAQERVNRSLASNSVMKTVKGSNASYVAVPVKAEKGVEGSKSGFMRVRVKEQRDGSLKATGTDSTHYANSREALAQGSTVYLDKP